MKLLALAAASALAASAQPAFDVVSIKPCTDTISPGARTGAGPSSPGRLSIHCQTARGLINVAYVLFANGRTMNFAAQIPIEGGPAWIDSDRYTIDATTAGPEKSEMMQGPMLQSVLEDRFHLKMHRGSRDVPVYDLTAAKNGPKLKPFKEGSCVPMDFLSLSKAEIAALSPDNRYCRPSGTMKAGMVILDAPATTLEDFAQKTLNGAVDRPIVNKTGIPGLFDLHLEYIPDESSPLAHRGGAASPSPAAPDIFAALQEQLGLKLQPSKAPGDFLVIDRIDKPTGN